MTVRLAAETLAQYDRFTLYNSPYAAHDGGCAVDLYPSAGDGSDVAPSPVDGEVVDTRTVRAPPKPYAPEHDHLILLDAGEHVVRVLHVDPAVEAGDVVRRGDSLGTLVRAGFFAPWVDNHLHVGFRRHDQHLYRAAGSLPLDLDVPVRALPWDGTGTVVETGATYALLDAPAHPAPGEAWVGIADDDGRVLDGGLRHYDGGGCYGATPGATVSLFGTTVGTVGEDGRTVDWRDVRASANDVPVTGLSLFCARDDGFGAKVICPDHAFGVGDRVRVEIRPTDDPVVLS